MLVILSLGFLLVFKSKPIISEGLLSFSFSSIPIIYHPPSEFANDAIELAIFLLLVGKNVYIQ